MGKGMVLVHVTYADGWSAAAALGPVADYHAHAQDVWRTHTDRVADGFVQALSGHHVPQRRLLRTLRTWRRAAADPAAWFAPQAPPPGSPGSNAARELYQFSTLGFDSWDHTHVDHDWNLDWEDYLIAQDHGIDLSNTEDRAWLERAGAGEWPCYHRDYWAGALHARDVAAEQGWSLDGVAALYRVIAAEHQRTFRERRDAAGPSSSVDAAAFEEVSVARWRELAPGPDADQLEILHDRLSAG